jgi:hypothetical protein
MQIIFAKGHSMLSDLIADIDGGDCSHVALASNEVMNGYLILHATHRGVEVMGRNTFKKHYDIKRIYEVPMFAVPDKESWWFKDLLVHNDSKKYDYLGLFWLGLYTLLRRIGIKIKPQNLWQNKNHFVCLEFVTFAIWGVTDSTITLSELENRLKEKLSGQQST